jgi:hypothetical protein
MGRTSGSPEKSVSAEMLNHQYYPRRVQDACQDTLMITAAIDAVPDISPNTTLVLSMSTASGGFKELLC